MSALFHREEKWSSGKIELKISVGKRMIFLLKIFNNCRMNIAISASFIIMFSISISTSKGATERLETQYFLFVFDYEGVQQMHAYYLHFY